MMAQQSGRHFLVLALVKIKERDFAAVVVALIAHGKVLRLKLIARAGML